MPSSPRRTGAMRRRILNVAGGGLAVSAVAAVLLATAVPADAHAVIDSHSSVPVDTDQTLNMYVPHELAESIYNTEVEIKVPGGWTNAACVAKASWTCAVEAGGTVVHFTKQGTSLMVDNENFPFTVHTASNVATFPFPTIQRYSNGEEAAWIGAPGSEDPAPTLRTVAGGVTPTDPAPTAPPHSTPTPTPTPGPTPTQPATGGQAPVPGQPTPPAPGGGAATTTAPGETTTTTASDPSGADADGTVAASASSGSPRDDRASGRDVVVEGDEETAAGITASDEPGSAVPVIATGTVVVALLAAGGALAVRKRAPATLAGDAGSTGGDVEVIAPDETEPPTP